MLIDVLSSKREQSKKFINISAQGWPGREENVIKKFDDESCQPQGKQGFLVLGSLQTHSAQGYCST